MKALKFEDLTANSDQYLRNVAVDNVIFGYHDKELKVLLQQPLAVTKWTVTGGYIKKSEDIAEAAKRIAFTRTGLDNLFFQQFGAFGSPTRSVDSEFTAQRLSEFSGIEIPANLWIFDYFVSLGFYTLTEFSKVKLKKGGYEAECRWWPVSELPPMMFDHKQIVSEALRALRLHIAYYPIGYELLPEKFTLPEIHNLYEAILGKPLDTRNFSKRLMGTGIIVKLNETKKIGAHRSPFLYTFDKEKYDEGLKNGVTLAF
ncbi:NUDIX domain-containing protein [Mucilaginibacter sp.]|jgi:ADP-ribose pyrophosphatase YjhB (NUDIX family)|uniref:NUDIX hydrolase n=1 Tax=Mucilaginibacter sp. TaxID=1882438 RepID=UPI00356572C4